MLSDLPHVALLGGSAHSGAVWGLLLWVLLPVCRTISLRSTAPTPSMPAALRLTTPRQGGAAAVVSAHRCCPSAMNSRDSWAPAQGGDCRPYKQLPPVRCLRALNAGLQQEERTAFGFDLAQIDWEDYIINRWDGLGAGALAHAVPAPAHLPARRV